MWLLRLETDDRGTVLADAAKRYSISFSGYPIGYRKEKGRLVVQTAGFVDGAGADLRRMVAGWRRLGFVRGIAEKGGFIIASFVLPAWLGALYSPDIIFTHPALYTKEGREILELAAWTKAPLTRLIAVFRRHYSTRIARIVRGDVGPISFIGMHPLLTERQKTALRLAVDNGYYRVPRAVTLKELAGLMGVSFSTYQAHLAKAEAGFVPYMFGRLP